MAAAAGEAGAGAEPVQEVDVYGQYMEESMFGGSDDEWEDCVAELDAHIASDTAIPGEWRAIELHPERDPSLLAESQQSYNLGKNRYTDVVPYDDTRVGLRPVVKRETKQEVPGSTYFNANWVKMGDGPAQTFIASHAPPPAAFQDWYRLLWENRVSVIVMLTGWVEGRRKKADNYLPDKVRSVAFGQIEARLVSEHQPSPHYIVREIKLVPLMGKRRERTIRHFHYLSWPDQGVPDESESMLAMMQSVHEYFEPSEESRQLVHCSAGIGRTGVWITLSAMLQEIAAAVKKDQVPKFSLMKSVHDMRYHRPGMMQRYEQYLFSYKTILNHLYKIEMSQTYRDQIKSGQKVLSVEDVQESDLAKRQALVAQGQQVLKEAVLSSALRVPSGGGAGADEDGWKAHWVVLSPTALVVMTGSEESKAGAPIAMFDLRGLVFEEEAAMTNVPYVMHLRDTAERHFQLAASSPVEMTGWIDTVTKLVDAIAAREAPQVTALSTAGGKTANPALDPGPGQVRNLKVYVHRVVPLAKPPSPGHLRMLKKVSYRLVAKLFTTTSRTKAVWRKKTRWRRQLEHGESSVGAEIRPLVFDGEYELSGDNVDPRSRLVFYLEQAKRGKVGRIVYKLDNCFQPERNGRHSAKVVFDKCAGDLEFTTHVTLVDEAAARRNRRFTRMDDSQLPSTMRGNQSIASGPETVFGVSLTELMDAQKKFYPNFQVPILFKRLVDSMFENGVLTTEGVFRLAPSMRELEVVREAIDAGQTVSVAGNPPSVHTACSLMKLFLRELPEPLIPTALYERACTAPHDLTIVDELPPVHRNVLALIVGFLQELAQHSEHTKMDIENLATVFAPGLLRCPYEDAASLMTASNSESSFVSKLLTEFDPVSLGNFLGSDELAPGVGPTVPTQPGVAQPPKPAGAGAAGAGAAASASPSVGRRMSGIFSGSPGSRRKAPAKAPGAKAPSRPMGKVPPKIMPKRTGPGVPSRGPGAAPKVPPKIAPRRAAGPGSPARGPPKVPARGAAPPPPKREAAPAPAAAAEAAPAAGKVQPVSQFCADCGRMFEEGDDVVNAKSSAFHRACVSCKACKKRIPGKMVGKGGRFYHPECRE